LFLVCSVQWLQGALQVLHADALGEEVWHLSDARHIEDATYLTLAWVSSIAIGAWLVLRGLERKQLPTVLESPINMTTLLIVYAIWSASVGVLKTFSIAPLVQAVNAYSALRWSVVFLIFVFAWAEPRMRVIAIAVLLLETVLGFLSFFSEFKTPLLLFGIALLTVGRRLTLRQVAAFFVLACATLYLGVLWSAIKVDYRDRLSGGAGHRTQQVVLSTSETIDELVDLVGTVDSDLLMEGAENLVARIAYVEYFAYVLDYVPALAKHEEGRLWLRAVQHVLVPRMFFPDKLALESDTNIAERYTGLSLGAGSGTSISIGLPAETYVDFGSPGMLVVAFLLGTLYGAGFRLLVTQGRGAPLAYGLAVAQYAGLTSVGSAATKILGGYVATLLVAVVLWRFFGRPVSRFIGVREAPAP
jgi:hypothetical protein